MTDEQKVGIFGIGLLIAGLLIRSLGSKEDFTIGEFYTVDQVGRSETATANEIQNTPTEFHLVEARSFAVNVLDPLIKVLGFVPTVNSWYRTGELTNFLYTGDKGGYRYSNHETAKTVDWDSPSDSRNHDIVQAILDTNTPFKELILEEGTMWDPGRIHLAWDPNNNKGDIKRMKNGKVKNIGIGGLSEFYAI